MRTRGRAGSASGSSPTRPASPRFRPSDSWILLALAVRNFRGSCSLRGLIAAADYLNRAIPVRAEIEGGINRLSAGGLAAVTPLGFSLTPESRRLLLRLEVKSRSLFRQRDMLAAMLPELKNPGRPAPRWRLGRERYRKAVAEYMGSFAGKS